MSNSRDLQSVFVRYADLIVGVKPDRMVSRCAKKALSVAKGAGAVGKAAALVRAAVRAKGWDVFTLDHTIWDQSSRCYLRP